MNIAEGVAEDVVFMKESNVGLDVGAGGSGEAEGGADDNCPICLETLNSTNIETIHGCGHEFCGDCVKVLRDRCDTYDSEGLGVKVVKCPMCRGTEAVSAEQLKKRVRELCTQKNLLAFEADDLRTKCKNMERAFATIRKVLPKTRDVTRAHRPGIDETLEYAVSERQRVAEIRRRRLDVERRLGFARQPAVQPAVRPAVQPAVQPAVRPAVRPAVVQPAVGQPAAGQPAVGQPAVRQARRRTRFGRGGQELGVCVVVGCRSKNRTTRNCDYCADFCCARCKKCSMCRLL